MKKLFDHYRHLIRTLIVGDFKQLLIFLVILFVFRPYNLGIDYVVIWHIFFAGVLLAAVFNCHHTKKVKATALFIGIPTFILNWWALFSHTAFSFTVALYASLIFLIFAIFSLLYRVILGKVTPDILRGTICVYFMIGFSFALMYSLMEIYYPHSFQGPAYKVPVYPAAFHHSEMVYFSFITLLAIGYGDITPTGDLGQMLAVAEGLVGHFYLAIIVARLVAAYAMRARAAAAAPPK